MEAKTARSSGTDGFGLPGWTVRINHGYASVVEIGGELTSDEVDYVTAALHAERHKPVVIDLAHCAFIDSSGIALLRSAARSFERRGQPLLIAGARGRVGRILSFSVNVPEVHPSASAALHSLTPEEPETLAGF